AQVDHGAARRKTAAVLGIEHGAATSGEHHVLHRGEFLQHLRFAGAKARLPFNVEDERHGHAAAALDLVVAVDETQFQPPREQAADGALAGAHHADEVEVAAALHDGIVEIKTAGRSRPQWRSKQFSYLMVRRSFTMRGVMKTRSSVLPVETEEFLN